MVESVWLVKTNFLLGQATDNGSETSILHVNLVTSLKRIKKI